MILVSFLELKTCLLSERCRLIVYCHLLGPLICHSADNKDSGQSCSWLTMDFTCCSAPGSCPVSAMAQLTLHPLAGIYMCQRHVVIIYTRSSVYGSSSSASTAQRQIPLMFPPAPVPNEVFLHPCRAAPIARTIVTYSTAQCLGSRP